MTTSVKIQLSPRFRRILFNLIENSSGWGDSFRIGMVSVLQQVRKFAVWFGPHPASPWMLVTSLTTPSSVCSSNATGALVLTPESSSFLLARTICLPAGAKTWDLFPCP